MPHKEFPAPPARINGPTSARQPLERCPTKGCPPHKPMINHWFSVDLPIEKKLIFFSNAAKILLIPMFHQRFTSVSPTFQP